MGARGVGKRGFWLLTMVYILALVLVMRMWSLR